MQIKYVGLSAPQMYLASSHAHECWELCLNVKGNGVTIVDGLVSANDSGTIYICPPKTIHSKHYGDKAFQDIFVKFNTDNEYEKRYFQSFGAFYRDTPDKSVEKLLFVMKEQFQVSDGTNDALLASLMNCILTILSRESDVIEDERVSKLCKIIHQNFTNPSFSPDEVMENMHYNKDHVRRCFKKEMGVSPVKYVNKLRIEKAVKLISERSTNKLKLPDIASMCGFCDYVYFSRVFKKYTGLKPTDFIK